MIMKIIANNTESSRFNVLEKSLHPFLGVISGSLGALGLISVDGRFLLQILEQTSLIDELKRRVAELDTGIADRDEEIDGLQESINRSEATCQSLEQQLSMRDGKLEQLEALIQSNRELSLSVRQ